MKKGEFHENLILQARARFFLFTKREKNFSFDFSFNWHEKKNS